MANYKRGKARFQSSPHTSRRNTLYHYWMSNYPRWWDILYHTRPRRRAIRQLEQDVLKGRVDVDDAAWPLGNHKPHHYYW